MAKAIVHVGLPKTGSTTLQRVLKHNKASLADQGLLSHRGWRGYQDVRYIYPAFQRMGRLQTNTGMNSFFGVANLADQERLVKELGREISSEPNAVRIISSEIIGTASRGQKYLKAMSDWFSEQFESVRYILYIREQSSWMISQYSEQIKQGRAHSFDEHMATKKPLDLDALVSRWEAAVGADNLDVRLFDPSFWVGGTLISDFSAALGVAPMINPKARGFNPSLGAKQLDYLRRFNARFPDEQHIFNWPHVKARRVSLARFIPDQNRLQASPESIARIRKIVAPSNERLRARRFPERDTLFNR